MIMCLGCGKYNGTEFTNDIDDVLCNVCLND